MPNKQFLDYDGLELYHTKIKESLKHGASGQQSGISEETRTMYGLGDDATADDIFQFLYITSANGASVVRFKAEYEDHSPCVGILINITKSSGNLYDITLGQSGVYLFKANSGESVTISISGSYADISGSVTVTAPENGIIPVTMTAEYHDFLSVSSSRTVLFSGKCTRVDVSLAGAGGGGGGAGCSSSTSNYSRSGSGGGGGNIEIHENIDFAPFEPYAISVGSGGSGGKWYRPVNTTDSETSSTQSGKAGGSTYAFGFSASGGSGGSVGNSSNPSGGYGSSGNGGNGSTIYVKNLGSTINVQNGSAGGDSELEIYASFTETAPAGGGGGGGGNVGYRYDEAKNFSRTVAGGTGGYPNGGYGGGGTITRTEGGINNDVVSGGYGGSGGIAGGGGGRAAFTAAGDATSISGGSGGQGNVAIRMWH